MPNTLHRQRSGLRAGFWRKRGDTFVEFALVVPLFFLLTFAVIDFGYIFYVKVTLENAMRQAGRFAITGNHLVVGTNVETRVQSIIQTATQAAVGLPISNIQISTVQAGTNIVGSAGGPGDPVTISLSVTYTFFTRLIGRYFPGGKYAFTVATTFRNENFPPSETN
jgi:Flp pilus assembly protein TadG